MRVSLGLQRVLSALLGNRFSRKKREKEKAEEDMAWQIAKMIISGINDEVSSSQEKPNPAENERPVQSTEL